MNNFWIYGHWPFIFNKSCKVNLSNIYLTEVPWLIQPIFSINFNKVTCTDNEVKDITKIQGVKSTYHKLKFYKTISYRPTKAKCYISYSEEIK